MIGCGKVSEEDGEKCSNTKTSRCKEDGEDNDWDVAVEGGCAGTGKQEIVDGKRRR